MNFGKKLVIIGLIIFVIVLSFFGTVFAVPELDFDQAFRYSDYVILGKIDSVSILSDPIVHKTETAYSGRSGIALYEITVLESFKNPDDVAHITVHGEFLYEPHPMAYETYPYEVGDVVKLYIQKNNVSFVESDLIIRSGNSKVEFNCTDAVNKNLPTTWKYHCYDEPLENPQREIDLENSMDGSDVPPESKEDICGRGTILVDGKCAPDYSVEKIKTVGDDAPFFGIFAYLDNLFSWIFGQ